MKANKMQKEVLAEMLKIVDKWNETCPVEINKDWTCKNCWELFPKSKCKNYSKDGHCELYNEKCPAPCMYPYRYPCPYGVYNKKDLVKKVKNYINKEE